MRAMILAAGLGKRMRPLTDALPKPLLPVGGKPLIEYHLERLAQAGVKDVVINVSYLGQLLEAHLGDGSEWQLSIQYSREKWPLETAGAVLKALPLLGDEPFLLVNGDVWTDYPFEQLLSRSLDESVLGHLVLVPSPEHNRSGDFGLVSNGRLVEPDPNLKSNENVHQSVDSKTHQATSRYTFSGISLLKPALVAEYPARREHFPLREPFSRAIFRQQLTGEVYNGRWFDIGTPERLHELDVLLAES